MLVRNAVLGAVAAVILLVPAVARYELEPPSASQAVPVLLVAAGLALIAWVALSVTRAGARR